MGGFLGIKIGPLRMLIQSDSMSSFTSKDQKGAKNGGGHWC